MKCHICQQEAPSLFKKKIMGRRVVRYFRCSNCQFVQTEKPDWLDEAYKHPVNLADCGYIERNLDQQQFVTVLLLLFTHSRGKFLDYAGGLGMLTRLTRDAGFDCYWHDKFSKNIFAAGFEGKLTGKYEAIFAFEALEHFVEPMRELQKIFLLTDTFICTTRLQPEKIDDWWYLGLDHGQHVSLFHRASLEEVAARLHVNFYTDGQLVHVLSRRQFSPLLFALICRAYPILFWLTKPFRKSKTASDSRYVLKNVL